MGKHLFEDCSVSWPVSRNDDYKGETFSVMMDQVLPSNCLQLQQKTPCMWMIPDVSLLARYMLIAGIEREMYPGHMPRWCLVEPNWKLELSTHQQKNLPLLRLTFLNKVLWVSLVFKK